MFTFVVEEGGIVKMIPRDKDGKNALDDLFVRFDEEGVDLNKTTFKLIREGGAAPQLRMEPVGLLKK